MKMMLNRADPDLINIGLKEAVAEALLGRVYAISSGEGAIGQTVTGNRPSRKFVSGFLEPAFVASQGDRNVDETANPIHIITSGLDFQLDVAKSSIVEVSASFSVYVRVLPTSEDLIKYKSHLELTANAKKLLGEAIRVVVSRFFDENESLRESDTAEFYRQLNDVRLEAANEYFIGQGVKVDELEFDNDVHLSEENLVGSEKLAEGESQNKIDEGDEKNDDEGLVVTDAIDTGFLVYPGSKNNLPASIVREVRPVQKWFRLDFDIRKELVFDASDGLNQIAAVAGSASDQLNKDLALRLEEWLVSEDIETGGRWWAYPKGLLLTPGEIVDWEETLHTIRGKYHSKGDVNAFSIPEISLAWQLEIKESLDQPELRFVHLALENTTSDEPTPREETEESIFLVRVSLLTHKSNHVDLRLERIKPSYRYNKYLNYPAIGFNSGVVSRRTDDSIELATTWIPIYRQPRIRPREYPNLDVRFETLASEEALPNLDQLVKHFDIWLAGITKDVDLSEGATSEEEVAKEREKFRVDLTQWELERDKILNGVTLLSESKRHYELSPGHRLAIPYRAFRLMNTTMMLAGKRAGYDSWRLFQLAFIVSNLSGFASRMPEFESYFDESWDDSVALLYFSTGGGKTEAFFGLLIFVLFLDRLRGKLNGVSAMLRYPLRLLTVQQAQRLSKILAFAEQVRWKEDISGKPFEIGFWVGGNNTPNRRNQVTSKQIPAYIDDNNPDEIQLLDSQEYRYAMDNWNKLPECPFCGAATALRKYKERDGLVGHACTSAECPWNVRHGGRMSVALPFYIVDDDIYDLAPSVLLGTIDKLALIGHSDTTIRRVFGMFGLAHFINKDSGRLRVLPSPVGFRDFNPGTMFERLSPMFEGGYQHWFDPFPAMIIQDETHLLEESLGTFSGIFETLFEHVLNTLGEIPVLKDLLAISNGQLRKPKIIAASATVMEPERQMEALYQRDVVQFPFPGPSIYESFYSTPLEPENPSDLRKNLADVELRAHRARLYASILTNGRPHTSTSVELLANFHYAISDALIGLSSAKPVEEVRVVDSLIESVLTSDLTEEYRDLLREAPIDAIATMIDLHRIALTYVTNKKGGDQIMAAENDTTARVHREHGVDFDSLNTELISGAVDSGEIERVIRKAESRPKVGAPLESILDTEVARSIVATSAISHGVDVNELNSMFFAGMPTDTSEYIQASSRIGRTHVGFSVLMPTPQRRRDRYILEVNDIYHRFLERMIRPAAVDRWAESALKRALPSIFLTYLIGVLETTRLLTLGEKDKAKAGDLGKLRTINEEINSVGIKKFTDDTSDFFANAIGLTHTKFGPSAVEQLRNILNSEIRNELVSDVVNYAKDFESIGSLYEHLDQEHRTQKKSPMTSLRDVDPAGSIRYVQGTSKVSSEDAYEIMKTIRTGTSGSRNA
jgi:hypothetical protein